MKEDDVSIVMLDVDTSIIYYWLTHNNNLPPSQQARPVPIKETNENKRAMWWYNFSRCITCCVPDAFIRKEDAEARQAWREKVAICFCVFLASLFFVGIFGFVPVMLCQERLVFTLPNVQERITESWIVVHGTVYDVTDLFNRHPTGPQGIEAFLHDEASRMFPRMPPATLPPICLNQAKFEDNEELMRTDPICEDFTEEDKKNGLPCHTFVTGMNATAKYIGEYEKGVLAHDASILMASPYTYWVSIHDRVYNVTRYINNIRNEQTKQIEKDHPMAYLEPTLNNLIVNKLNEDATELFLSVYPDDRILRCMDELFYVGIIDTRFDVICFVLNILMYFLLGFVATIMVAQMLCSLMYIAKGTRTYTDVDTQDQVIVMVPCYNEGGQELIKTIDSVISTTYPEENKVIFIIADGVVTGAGQELSTPEHLAEILGFEMDRYNDELYEYDSIGLLTTNKARVYHGYYEVDDKSLKYLVVVKHGLPMEQTGSAKPGNRGKRDSQLVIMGYFNRIYHGRELNELDAAIEDALIDLNMQSDDMRLLMTIDADTRVDEMSITHMVYAMNQDEKILALCGETKVDNKWQSWVTMMQVFEYYNNHHMKKAFESAFGCVTCLPGCFTMYRILNDDGKPLLADDHVYAEYLRNDIDSLHEQNLFHLGEDRMLTTLLLHFFPGMFLSYVPEAQCWTITPHTLRILLSQRRRWINSTYHNLLELTKVKTMCGVCCCSMKTVVYLDLVACMILPASTVYAVYLIFLVAAGKTKFSLLLLVLYGLLIGVQLVVFIVRSRYDFLFWFIFFTIVGVPVFYFILPLYAFWHMDDFSWGETRKVAAMKEGFGKPPPQETDRDDDDESDEESEVLSRRSSGGSRSRASSKRSFT
jgi:chitin synthase